MLNSTILDVVIGLAFGFLAVSLVTSAIVEAINSAFKLRSKSLLAGVKQLVNDPGFNALALALYRHASINPRGAGGSVQDAKTRPPAYIDPKQFANALLDVTGLSAASVGAAAPGPAAVAAMQAAIADIKDPQIKALLDGIVQRSRGDLSQIRAEISDWFDTAMDRVSGAFKRWTQLATFVIALIISMLINVDSIRIGRALWEQPTISARLMLPEGAGPTPAAADLASHGVPQGSAEAIAAQAVLDVLEANLPVGWPSGHVLEVRDEKDPTKWSQIWSSGKFGMILAGWFVTAMASLFGAPFWFDVLQTVVRLKGSGPSPKEKANGDAAAA